MPNERAVVVLEVNTRTYRRPNGFSVEQRAALIVNDLIEAGGEHDDVKVIAVAELKDTADVGHSEAFEDNRA